MLRNTRYAEYNLQGLKKRPHAVPHVRFLSWVMYSVDSKTRRSPLRICHVDPNRMARHWSYLASADHFMVITATNKGCVLIRRCEPPDHKIVQHLTLSPSSNFSNAALVAASKTSSTPSPVSDEHSRYLLAPIA